MLSVWWDFKGIFYFELLPRNQTINYNVYCRQLMNLEENNYGKAARPHTSLVTRKKLLELGWEVMPHSPYSPDLALFDYNLFRSLKIHLIGKTFDSNEAVKNEHI